ncbi:hypothetical protein ACA910_011449 [Epithemia clementina (nom. ined.)]
MILIQRNPYFPFLDTSAYMLVANNKASNEGNGIDNGTPVEVIQNVQVSEAENSFALSMDLPGVKDSNVQITETDYKLTVEAMRKRGDKDVCKFQRSFALDKKSVDPDGITASLVDGVLTVRIPKKPLPKTLEIVPSPSDPPVLDVEEGDKKGHAFHFQLELPGVKLQDLKVSVTGEDLHISAERKTGQSKSVIKRYFTVDQDRVDTAKMEAYLLDGILTITAPAKASEKESKEVSVTTRSFAVNGDQPNVNTASHEQETIAPDAGTIPAGNPLSEKEKTQ